MVYNLVFWTGAAQAVCIYCSPHEGDYRPSQKVKSSKILIEVKNALV